MSFGEGSCPQPIRERTGAEPAADQEFQNLARQVGSGCAGKRDVGWL